MGMSSARAQRRGAQEQQRLAKTLARLSPAATEVVLVRHGETDWNLEHRLQGQSSTVPGLNRTGRRQAEALARHFASETAVGSRVDAIYSSDLTRAVETAECIAQALGLRVETTSALRERHLGLLQGLTPTEAAVVQPAALAALRGGDSDVIPGGGESIAQLRERAATGVRDVAARHPGGRVLLVVHGGVLQALHVYATGRAHSRKVLNASVGILKLELTAPKPASASQLSAPTAPSHGLGCSQQGWVIVAWNDVQHLHNEGVQVDGQGFGGGSTDG